MGAWECRNCGRGILAHRMRIKTVDLPTIKITGRDGRSGNGRWVRRDGNITVARRQEQSCEGSNPMSDAATASRGKAERGRPVAEHRLEGNGRCMIGRSAFAHRSSDRHQTGHWARTGRRWAKNRRDERRVAATLGKGPSNKAPAGGEDVEAGSLDAWRRQAARLSFIR